MYTKIYVASGGRDWCTTNPNPPPDMGGGKYKICDMHSFILTKCIIYAISHYPPFFSVKICM